MTEPSRIIYGEEYREANTHQNSSETPLKAIKRMFYIKQEKSILFFLLFWTILYDRYIPMQTPNNNAATQRHVDGFQGSIWAACDTIDEESVHMISLRHLRVEMKFWANGRVLAT